MILKILKIALETHSDAWWTIIGVGVVALGVIITLLLMKWESHRATTYWGKRNRKNGKIL